MSFDLKISGGNLVIKNGDLDKVLGSDKLIQDILKICLTTAGSNPFHPYYGSLVSRSLIGSVLDNSFTITMAESQLRTSLENLKQFQNLQIDSGQKVSADEQLAAIMSVSIGRNKIDQRLFEIEIKVLTKSYRKVETSFRVSTLSI